MVSNVSLNVTNARGTKIPSAVGKSNLYVPIKLKSGNWNNLTPSKAVKSTIPSASDKRYPTATAIINGITFKKPLPLIASVVVKKGNNCN